MTIHYSPSNGGFYDSAIHRVRPDDCIEITKQRHHELMSAQSSGKRIVHGADGFPVAADPDPITPEKLQQLLSAEVQKHLDAQSRSMGYDNIFTAVTYADEPAVPKFQSEGQALRAWRSQVWAACGAILSDVNAGTRDAPTPSALLAELPAFQKQT